MEAVSFLCRFQCNFSITWNAIEASIQNSSSILGQYLLCVELEMPISDEAHGAVSLCISVVCVHQKDMQFDTVLARDSLKL